jgi:hypothetical protein
MGKGFGPFLGLVTWDNCVPLEAVVKAKSREQRGRGKHWKQGNHAAMFFAVVMSHKHFSLCLIAFLYTYF